MAVRISLRKWNTHEGKVKCPRTEFRMGGGGNGFGGEKEVKIVNTTLII
jgi:hypothetical protein